MLDLMTGRAQNQLGSKRDKNSAGELGIIRLLQSRAARASRGLRTGLQLGIGDDCAILRPLPGEEIVVTTDFSLEGRHFRRDWHSPQSIGHRLLARGLSDLASMGARPLSAFLSLALPKAVAQDKPWLDAFLDGFFALAKRTRVPLGGGDTAEAPGKEILTDIVLVGSLPQGRALRRGGARPGDRLFITGRLGGATAQLQALREGVGPCPTPTRDSAHEHPHYFPEPRLPVGTALLRKRLATAAIDLSDGLSTDLQHLCEASNVGAEIQICTLPLHPLLRRLEPPAQKQAALHGGEDYELLFTAPVRARVPRQIASVPLTEIGRIVARKRGQPRVLLTDENHRSLTLFPQGWEHFR